MAVLDTWGQYSTYTDAAGRYRVIWQDATTGQILMHKFEIEPTLLEMELHFADVLKDVVHGGLNRLRTELDSNVPAIINAVAHIRTHPNLTLNQWNTYLAGLTWYDAATVRTFIFQLAVGLAQHYGLQLDDYTETQVLLRVRNWICNTGLNVVKRIIFGYLINL